MSDFDDPPRKRAPLTGPAFDFARTTVPCPQCLKEDRQPIAELVANDTTACRFCGAVILLTTDEWRATLAKEAHGFKQIKPM